MQDGGHQGLSEPLDLCALDDIDDPGGKGFRPDDRPPIFVIRRGAEVWGYINACPHQGVPLDWRPDWFLNYDKTRIQCATHGAQFVIETGECVAGPCPGVWLQTVPVAVRDGRVVLGESG